MASANGHSFLNRGISVYTIPPQLLANLNVRSIQSTTSPSQIETDTPKQRITETTAQDSSDLHQSSLRCQTCPNAIFDTVEEQREHFRSDWHRYNVKAKLTGRAVGAEEWDGMVEGISSISGSASSASSSSSTHSQSKISRLLARQTISTTNDDTHSEEAAEHADRERRALLRTAIIWFTPSQPISSLGIPKDTQFGIHRALFPPFENAGEYLSALRGMQLGEVEEGEEGEERRLTLLMVAGGHFAGMVVGIRNRGPRDKQLVKGAGDVRVIKSKTFHRYTTRKKQGGSQGLNDQSKGAAISAGAMLRRYGEQALQDEIRVLLKDWEDDLGMSERIFIRASTHGKRSFWGYEGAVLDKNDERIRGFPFPTRRPTIQELLRCWHELTRVKISHLSEEALQAQDEAYIISLQPRNKPIIPKPTPTPSLPATVIPRLTPEEEAKKDRLRRLEEMVRKGRLDALKPFFEKYASEIDGPHILGLAASSGQEEVVRWLLDEKRVDPTIALEGPKRAYDLSSSKGVRNVFRRVAYDHPEWYDWGAGHVPSGLSEEAENAQEKKKDDRRKALREKMKEREKAKGEKEKVEGVGQEGEEEERVEEVRKVVGGGGSGSVQKLGGRIGGDGNLAGMTQEMRMKIERERRARAAEARLGGR